MNPVDVSNLALAEGATRTSITGFPPLDNSPAAVSAGMFYTPKVQGLMRAANWDFCRRQVLLTLDKAAIVNGVPSTDPPPQPWQYQYLYPADALKARFLIQYQTTTQSSVPFTTAPGAVMPSFANTRVPFVVAADVNSLTGAPRKVLLTNMQNAMLIYTADLSQAPDMWDRLFLSAVTATLAAYFVQNLSGDKALMNQQVQLAKGVLDSARAANGNESISNTDHLPDWIQARFTSGGIFGWGGNANGVLGGGWDACEFPGGIWY